MSESNGGSGGVTGFLIGALVGVVAGAGVSLLLAPRSGKDTREWLAVVARKTKDKSTHALQRGRDAFRRKADEVAGGQDSSSHAEAGATKIRN